MKLLSTGTTCTLGNPSKTVGDNGKKHSLKIYVLYTLFCYLWKEFKDNKKGSFSLGTKLEPFVNHDQMTDANIDNLYITYSNYLNGKYVLGSMNSYSRKNLKIIHDVNPIYALIVHYISMRMKSVKGKDNYVEATTFEFPKNWFTGMVRRSDASKHLKTLCRMRVLSKVNDNQRCSKYRVNPIFINVMTRDQKQMYFDNDYALFNPNLLKSRP